MLDIIQENVDAIKNGVNELESVITSSNSAKASTIANAEATRISSVNVEIDGIVQSVNQYAQVFNEIKLDAGKTNDDEGLTLINQLGNLIRWTQIILPVLEKHRGTADPESITEIRALLTTLDSYITALEDIPFSHIRN